MDELLRAAGAFVPNQSGEIVVRRFTEVVPSLVKLIDPAILSEDLKRHLVRICSMPQLKKRVDAEFIHQVSRDIAAQEWKGLDRQSVDIFLDVINHSLDFWSLETLPGGNATADNGEIIADGCGAIVGSFLCEGGGAGFFGMAASLIQANPPNLPEEEPSDTDTDTD